MYEHSPYTKNGSPGLGGVARTKLFRVKQFFMAVLDMVESLEPNIFGGEPVYITMAVRKVGRVTLAA